METWRSSGLARGTRAAKCGKHLVPLVTLRKGHNQEQGDALGDCLLLASREHPGTHSQKLREKLAFQVSILVAQTVKGLPTMQETQVRSLCWEDPLEKEMATHSSTLAWKSHGWRILVGYSLWGHKESAMTSLSLFHSV